MIRKSQVAVNCDVFGAGADLSLGWKGLSLGPPIFGGHKIFRVRKISSIFVSKHLYFCFGSTHISLLCRLQKISIEELERRIEVNDNEHSLFMTLKIGYMYNAWNKTPESIFQITRGQAVRYFRSAQVSLLLLLWVRWMRGKDKTSLHCSEGYRNSVEQNVNCL